MPNELNYDGIVKWASDFLAKDQAVPKNTTADGNGGSFELSGAQASLEVIAEATENIVLTPGSDLSISLQHSDSSESFTNLMYLSTLESSSGASKGILGKAVIPTDAKKYVKAVLETDDASAAGKVNIFVNHIPR